MCPACLLRGAEAGTFPSCNAPSSDPPLIESLAGWFPQLEMLELIGAGGMGVVYKARQKNLGRIVALKILPPGTGGDPAFAARFTREARALAKLNHPGIVTLYEFGQTEPTDFGDHAPLYYFLMEYVDGINLKQLLEKERVAAREALAIVPQICDALQYAHDHGIIHRDIKPENILLDRLGRVKVADFGLAKITGGLPDDSAARSGASAAGDVTETGRVMGTPHYMSPEQTSAPDGVDHRADIYALGVVFYQMLTGELPGKRIEAPSRKVGIDVRLDEIVLRALAEDPELRYQQASVMKTRVEELSSGTASPADPPSEPVADAPAARKAAVNRRRVVLAALAVLGLAIAVPLFFRTIVGGATVPVTAEFDRQVFIMDRAEADEAGGLELNLLNDGWTTREMSREAFLRLRDHARLRHAPEMRRYVGVAEDGAGRKMDSWSVKCDRGDVADGSGWLGISEKKDRSLEVDIGYQVRVPARTDPEGVRLFHKGPVAPDKVLAFLLPVPRTDGSRSLLVMGFQVASGATVAGVTDNFHASSGHTVFHAANGDNVRFVIYGPDMRANHINSTSNVRARTWRCGGNMEFPDGRVCPFSHDSARAAWVNIGAQAFNLHDGGLLVLDAPGEVRQLPVFPRIETVKDMAAITKVVEMYTGRDQGAGFGPVREFVLHDNRDTVGLFNLESGTGISVSNLPRLLSDDEVRGRTLAAYGVDLWALRLSAGGDGGTGAAVAAALCRDNREPAPAGPWRGVILCGATALPLESTAWDTLAPGDAVAAMNRGVSGRLTTIAIGEPDTWLIRTREGNTGILRITGISEDPEGVGIRYKMVQAESLVAPGASGDETVATPPDTPVQRGGASLAVMGRLHKLAEANRGGRVKRAGMVPQIDAILAQLTDVGDLCQIALLCNGIAYPQDAGNVAYDEVFDVAMWRCVRRIAEVPGEKAAWTLRGLKSQIGSDAGGSVMIGEAMEKQAKLPAAPASPPPAGKAGAPGGGSPGGTTPENAEVDALRDMLDRDPKAVNKPDRDGVPPLLNAASPAAIRFLVELGADVKAKTADGETALHFAAGRGQEEIVKLLLRSGADPAARNNRGITPLHCAAMNLSGRVMERSAISEPYHGHDPIIRALSAVGADVNAKADDGETPLHCAVASGGRDEVQALIAAGAGTNARDARDRTPLHAAAAALGNPHAADIVAMLINGGADPAARDKDSQTPMHLAAAAAHVTALLAMLESGADVEITDSSGFTPLHRGIYDAETVRVLLKHGANVHAVTQSGFTPWSLVTKPHMAEDRPEIMAILREFGGDRPEAAQVDPMEHAISRAWGRVSGIEAAHPALAGFSKTRPESVRDARGLAETELHFESNATLSGKDRTPSAADASKPFCYLTVRAWRSTEIPGQPAATQRAYHVRGESLEGDVTVFCSDDGLARELKDIFESEMRAAEDHAGRKVVDFGDLAQESRGAGELLVYEKSRGPGEPFTGTALRTFPDGRRTSTDFREGKGDGWSMEWHPNGRMAVLVPLVNGTPHGVMIRWDLNGNETSRTTYEHGKQVEQEIRATPAPPSGPPGPGSK